MDEFYYPDELEIGSADYENSIFKPKTLETKGLEEFFEKKNNNEKSSWMQEMNALKSRTLATKILL